MVERVEEVLWKALLRQVKRRACAGIGRQARLRA